MKQNWDIIYYVNFTYRHSYNNFQVNTEELKSHKNYVNTFYKNLFTIIFIGNFNSINVIHKYEKETGNNNHEK